MTTEFLAAVLEELSLRLPNLENLEPLVARLESGSEELHQAFVDQGQHPELPAQAIGLMQKALARLEGAAMDASSALEEGDREALGLALAIANENLETILGVETGYSEAVYRGPACHPYLNRVLLHLGYFFREGQETGPTRALLAESAGFFSDILALALPIPAPSLEGETLTARVGPLLTEFELDFQDLSAWLDGDRELPELEELQSRLFQHSQELALELASEVESNVAAGPTRWSPMNLLLVAAERCQAGLVNRETLWETIEQTERLLTSRFSEPTLVEAAGRLRALLLSLVEAEDLAPILPELIGTTEELFELAAGLENHEELVDMVQGDLLEASSARTDGLPPLLASLYRLSEAFLARSATEAELSEGILALQTLISHVAAAPPSDEAASQTLTHLTTVADSLTELKASRATTHLENAYEAMLRACHGMSSTFTAHRRRSEKERRAPQTD